MAFSNNLRYLRKKNSWSQDTLAEKLGYKSFTTIQKWESGVSEPSVSMVQTIATLFNVSMDELVNSDLEMPLESASLVSFPSMPSDEAELLTVYRTLNSDGQEKVITYATDLSSSGRYAVSDNSFQYNAVAAHERTDIEVTDEMRQFDDDIMNSEDF